MKGRIGQLHTNYHLIGQPDMATAGLCARLNRLAADRLAGAMAESLSKHFDDEDAVYVLREVETSLWLQYHDGLSATQIAQRWGAQLGGRIVRSIAADPGDGRNLRRFDNEAQFVSHFIVALLNGHAWDTWYYGAFRPYRQPSVGSTLLQVLLARKASLPSILRLLAEARALEKMLSALAPDQLSLLWQMGLEAAPLLDEAALRPLWLTTARLLTALDLWSETVPNLAQLWPVYLATMPLAADWRDRRALAAAIVAIIRFLSSRGHLKRPPLHEASFEHRLKETLPGLDWLDGDWLEQNLREWFTSEGTAPPASGRSQTLTTPRQKALLQDLLDTLHLQRLSLDQSQLESAANALRLYAALVAHAGTWAGELLPTALIARILNLSGRLRHIGTATGALEHLRRGDLQRAVALTAESEKTEAALLFGRLLNLGPEAVDIVSILLSTPQTETPQPEPIDDPPFARLSDGWLPSAYAGVFLLLRACVDLRLPDLVRKSGWPPAGEIDPLVALLAALGMRLAGTPDDHHDPGLSLWAGSDQRPATISGAWPATKSHGSANWQNTLLQALSDLRLIQPGHMLLYELHDRDQPVLLAADASGALWPFAHLLPNREETRRVQNRWQSAWQSATGTEPVMLTSLSVAQDDQWRDTYQQGGDTLAATFAAFEHGRLNIPEEDINLALLSAALLRVWSRWLRQFATSSPPYLLRQFIRRPGALKITGNRLQVALPPHPLDIVLEMAGYLSAVEYVPWLPYSPITFQTGDVL